MSYIVLSSSLQTMYSINCEKTKIISCENDFFYFFIYDT